MNEILSDIEQENENIKNRKIDHELYILSFPLIARMRMNPDSLLERIAQGVYI